MKYLGDFRLGDTFDTKFTTVNTSGVPTTLAGTPAVSVYNGNSTTQSTTGITLTVDFDSVTGLHNVRVVATSGNGYATATNYQLVITTGTVGGSSVVGYVIGEFSIENRSALMPTTAARTLDVSAGGEAGLDWANIGSPTTAQNLSATNIDVDQVVASVSGAVGSVTGNVGGNVTGSVGSVATGGVTRASFAADTGLQTIRSNTAQAGASGSITLDASASATNDFYNNAVVLITGGTGVGQVRRISDYVGATKVASVVPNWATNPDNTSTFAVLPDISGWDEVLADHLTSGSTGAALNAAGAAGDPWSTTLPGAYGAGSAGFIVGTNLDATVSSRLAPTVAARTLDVTAGGAAGIDWGNVENVTTIHDFTSTTIGVVTSVVTVGAVNGLNAGAIGENTIAGLEIARIQSGLATQASVDDIPTNSEFSTALAAITGTNGALIGSEADGYPAQIEFTVDGANTRDEYTVSWFKNLTPLSAGITSPTIQVVKRADGTDLIAEASLTQIGSTGTYRFNTTTEGQRLTEGEAAIVIVTATIDGSERTWKRLISRDAEAA